MGLSVHDIFQLPILGNSKVRAGHERLNEKSIEWVSVIELPVENFVRKNEFVLTTGIGCEGDPDVLEMFVKDVIQSGASVLAIATGRYVFDIPDRIIQTANKHDLILVDLPWEIRFGDILQAVMQKITLDRQEERDQAESIRQQLINCVLQDKDLQEIAHTLYKAIRIPVAITDRDKVIRANKHMSNQVLNEFRNSNTNDKLQRIPSDSIPFNEHPLYYHIEEYKLDNTTFIKLHILNNHKIQGHLLIQPKNRDQLTWFVMNVLEHALTACALYFVKENAIEITEIRLKDNFVLNLAKQQADVDEQLISKAKLLGYDLDCTYICLVGDIGYKDTVEHSDNDRPSNSSLQSLNYYIQKEITYAGKMFNRNTMATFDDGEVIIYLEADHHSYSETVNQFLDKMERRLSELLAGMVLSWGVSTHEGRASNFHERYNEAKTALEIGIKRSGKGERTFFRDTKINRLLISLSKEDEIASIVKSTIQPLLDYDEKRQTDLIYTFMIYNKYKGNVSQTARALNLHRQSLLHRLRKIESLTKLSLVESDDYFLLDLSVRLWNLNKII